MRRRSILSCACLGLLWLVGACDSNPSPSLGSDTNWLKACTADEQCDSSTCRCGVCTRSCQQAADCGAAAEGRLCIEAGELSETSCRVAFADAVSSGFCSQPCLRHADCGASGGSTAFCVEGTCLPAGAMTPRGSVASVAGDAGVPVAAADAGLPGSMTGSGGATAGQVDAAIEDAGMSTNTPPVGDAGTLGGSPRVEIPGGGGSIEAPNPQPQCPCQSDLPAGAPLPALDEVPRNPYGRPQAPAQPTKSPLEGGDSFLLCPYNDVGQFWWFNAETECVRFENCSNPCQSDAECPGGGSGSAVPRCSTTDICYLDCQQERACPEGMACVSGSDGAACYWPREVLAPGCAAYCRQSPKPRDCDDWCADLLVACDPDEGVICCDGLICTEGGYCDEIP